MKAKILLLFNSKGYVFDNIILYGNDPYNIKQKVICSCGCMDNVSYHQARQRSTGECSTCVKSKARKEAWVKTNDLIIKEIIKEGAAAFEKKGEIYHIISQDGTLIKKRLKDFNRSQ